MFVDRNFFDRARSHSRIGQVFGAQDGNVICLAPGDGRNLAAESLRQVFGFLPGALNRPYRRADEICSAVHDP